MHASFEPVRESFDTLTKARGLDRNWRGYNVALGAKDGELEMNIYQGSVFNSFLKPAETGTTRCGPRRSRWSTIGASSHPVR